ncbi:MAG: DUF5666 domain-containing protein [Patescibacteria group bacterium]
MNKIIANISVIAVVIAGAAFYGGMTFQKNQDSLSGLAGSALTNKLASLGLTTPDNGLAAQNVNGTFQNGRFPGGITDRQFGGGMVTGKIISANSKSVTVQQQTGATTTVYFSDITDITKSSSGTAGDLSNGTNIMVSGTSNSDGSVTASTIRINPETFMGTTGASPTY